MVVDSLTLLGCQNGLQTGQLELPGGLPESIFRSKIAISCQILAMRSELVLGRFWVSLDGFGWFWVGFGWFWVVLGGFGRFWVVLGGFGSPNQSPWSSMQGLKFDLCISCRHRPFGAKATHTAWMTLRGEVKPS